MPKLPGIEALGEGPVPSPQGGIASYRGPTGGETAQGDALVRVGAAMGHTADEMYAALKREQEKADTTRVEDAWNQYKMDALDLTLGEKGVLKAKGANAVNGGLMKLTEDGLTTSKKRLLDSLDNDEQRRRFELRAQSTDLQTKHSVLAHLEGENREYQKITMQTSEAVAGRMIAANPLSMDVFTGERDKVMAQADVYLRANGITDKQAVDTYKDKINDSLWVARIDALLYTQPMVADALFRANEKEIKDPKLKLLIQAKTREAALSVSAGFEGRQAVDEIMRKTPPAGSAAGSFDAVVASLLKKEGGYVASDGKSGAPANFGINQKANPDIEVATLTRDGAIEIYRKRYWEKIGGDSLAPATALVALDTAALQGPEVAKRLIAQTGGDPQAMIAVRRQQLQELAEKDPEQRPNLKGWMNRLDTLAAEVAQMPQGTVRPGPLTANTNGQPSARDVAAQLPAVLARVEQRANELYGPDPGNPDRAAFIVRARSDATARLSEEVQKLNGIQRQAEGALLNAVLGPAPGTSGSGITSFAQIQANPALMKAFQDLDPAMKPHVVNLIDKNLAASDRGDPVLFRELWNRVHLEPGDPRKIDFYQQVTSPDIANRLSMVQLGQLRQEIDRDATPGGRSVNQQLVAASKTVESVFHRELQSNVAFAGLKLTNPSADVVWANQWKEATGRKVDEYVKAGKDVRTLFMLETPDSVVKPEYLRTFMGAGQSSAAGLSAAAAAGKTPPTVPPVSLPAGIDTRAKRDEWIKTLPPNVTSITMPDGKVYPIQVRSAVPAPDMLRPDGTEKGQGFLGPLSVPGGNKVATEYSVGVNIDGKEMDVPSLVPTLTPQEVQQVLVAASKNEHPPEAVIEKARQFAEQRIKEGKPVFAQSSESPAARPSPVMTPTGKVETPEPTPAAIEITVDDFKITERPTTVAGQIAARRKAREGALELRRAKAIGPQYEVLGLPTSVARGAVEAGKAVLSVPAAVGSAIQAQFPTEIEAVYAGFEAIKQSRSITVQDEDILLEVLRYGLLSPADERLARGLLVKIQERKQ